MKFRGRILRAVLLAMPGAGAVFFTGLRGEVAWQDARRCRCRHLPASSASIGAGGNAAAGYRGAISAENEAGLVARSGVDERVCRIGNLPRWYAAGYYLVSVAGMARFGSTAVQHRQDIPSRT